MNIAGSFDRAAVPLSGIYPHNKALFQGPKASKRPLVETVPGNRLKPEGQESWVRKLWKNRWVKGVVIILFFPKGGPGTWISLGVGIPLLSPLLISGVLNRHRLPIEHQHHQNHTQPKRLLLHIPTSKFMYIVTVKGIQKVPLDKERSSSSDLENV